jgi:hypothetical protein
MSGDTLSAVEARSVLERNWRPPGFCVPNATTYPWQWLWDSCFHAVCWAHLGEGARAVAELGNVLAHQGADGFVPHLTYWDGTDVHAGFWGRRGTSSITQPPMYGHAVAELTRLGVPVPEATVRRARRGLAFLLDRQGTGPDGSAGAGPGPVIVHPWESGCDDSPRWDGWSTEPWSFEHWKVRKGELVEALRFDGGSPVGSDSFEVVSAGFAALVAFNARELASVTGDAELEEAADAVVAGLGARWRADAATWVDDARVGPVTTTAVRTLDALLPVLVVDDRAELDAGFGAALDDAAFGGACGPAGVHRDEPAFDPRSYWRGPAWPQLTYLLWVAARRHGRAEVAADLADRLIVGARRSGMAEYWHPDTGEGLGAVPQSWSALAAVVATG